jgi:hypothetical protein
MSVSTILPSDLDPVTDGASACDHLAELAATRTKFQTFLTWLLNEDVAATVDGTLSAGFKEAIVQQLLLDAAKKGWLVMSDLTTGYLTLVEKLLLTKLDAGVAVDGDTLRWDDDAIDATHGAWVPWHEFASSNSAVPPPSTGGIVEAIHGLGYTPTRYRAHLVCISADVGYVIGDIVDAQGLIFYNSGAAEIQQGANVTANATKVSCVFRNGGGTPNYQLLNKSTWARDTIDVLKWEVKFTAS